MVGFPDGELFGSSVEWLRGGGEASDVVISSRVRLARNLAGFPFTCVAGEEDRAQVLRLCREQATGAAFREAAGLDRVVWVDLHETGELERKLLVERHLISRQHASGKLTTGGGGPGSRRAVAIGQPGGRVSMMINEEDEIRLQALGPGLCLERLMSVADAADDALEQTLDYAFHPRFGYLTSCPTNVGTGVRFSAMLHLPALRMTGEIERVKRAGDDLGLAVRGFYGEGSDALGDLYQVSNQTTIGKSEGVLLEEMRRDMLPRLIEYERHARREMLEKRRDSLEDKVHRALGTLRSARLLGADEALRLLGLARLGVVVGLIEGVGEGDLNRLVLLVQPAHLQHAEGRSIGQQERRVVRARLVREALSA